jgi:hypothetical protein
MTIVTSENKPNYRSVLQERGRVRYKAPKLITEDVVMCCLDRAVANLRNRFIYICSYDQIIIRGEN